MSGKISNKFLAPHLIEFSRIGKSDIGYISILELGKELPFSIKRVFWTYYTPNSVIRGNHAHIETEQVLIAVAGTIKVSIEQNRKKFEFLLQTPNQGVYVPPDGWHTMEYSHDAVQVVFASTVYNEADYIRKYDEFKKIYL